MEHDQDGLQNTSSGEQGPLVCPWCGGTELTQGKMTTYGGIGFMADQAGAMKRFLSNGQPIRVRRCDGCGHLDLVAQLA